MLVDTILWSARAATGALALAIAPALLAQASPDTPRANEYVVECGVLITGEGQRLENGALVVRDGRITAVLAAGEARPALRRVDASDKVVMPGLVAADTDLADISDTEYQVTPDFLALDGFDFLKPRKQVLSGGVTTAYLAPGRNRLIPGRGSVVKMSGDDVIERVLADENCLRITLDARSTNAPPVFEPTYAPNADDPLVPARRQVPSAKISQLWRLRQVFDEAARSSDDPDELLGPGQREERYDAQPLRDVLSGKLPLRIGAREAADIRRALGFAREIGASIVLEDPWELGPVARDLAQESNAITVLRVPVLLGRSNPGGEDLARLDDPARQLDTAALAERAGIRFALAPASDDELADLLLVAGFAIRHGVSPDRATRAITIDAARALGVADRVGSLAPGKDADFLVLSGEPFAVGTLVEQTWIDGVKAFEREVRSDVLVVRADTVMTGEGRTIAGGGAVIAKAGRINAVGAGLAVPFGAAEITLPPGSVIVPGFINAQTSAGLSGHGTSVPTASNDQRIADVVDPSDPVLAEIARAGVTTLLVSGAGGYGRITAIKTAAEDRKSLVLEEIVGVRLAFDAITDGSIKAVAGQIDGAKKYSEQWAKYEKELDEWKVEQAKPKSARKKIVKKAEPEETTEEDAGTEDPISGVWEFEVTIEQPPITMEVEADLKLAGDGAVSGDGELTLRLGPREISREITIEGASKYADGTLTLEVGGGIGSQNAMIEGTVANEKFDGTADFGQIQGQVSGERVEKGEGGPATSSGRRRRGEDGRPKPPKTNEGLEPMRAVVEKRAVAVVHTNRAGAIEQVVKLFAERELALVLQGIDDAIDTPEILGDKPPPVLLGPDLVDHDRGKLVNAPAVLADRSIPLAFGTGDTLGARLLPLQTAHAIRYGLDPEAALRGLTSDVAAAFGIDDRVGSLVRGKDADFVAFSGNPFEPTSRVLLVVVNGRIVTDNRERGQ